MSDKRIILEFISLYRDFKCLWDNREILYSNKEARDQAYEVLLEKYKSIQDDASIVDVKKKIENMRCCFRREHKKVLSSRLRGDLNVYRPSLWYYEHLTFLNEVLDFCNLDVSSKDVAESLKIEFDDGDSPPKMKKRRSMNVSTIYLPEQHDGSEGDDDHIVMPSNQDMDDASHASIGAMVNDSCESEAFGRTIGLQLKELDSMQRTIAEKIISDVIFYGRLNKLTVNSSISMNE